MQDLLRRLFCSCLAIFIASSTAATVMRPLSEADLVQNAEVIVLGTCTKLESVRRDRVLMTRVTVELEETLKGQTASTITLWNPGGFDNSGPVPLGTMVPGAPVFLPDEKVLLFLGRPAELKNNEFVVLGLAQGKYSIYNDSQERPMVRRQLGGLQTSDRGTPNTSAIPLEDFKNRIRAHLRKSSSSP